MTHSSTRSLVAQCDGRFIRLLPTGSNSRFCFFGLVGFVVFLPHCRNIAAVYLQPASYKSPRVPQIRKNQLWFCAKCEASAVLSAGAKCSLKNRVQIAFLADHNRKSSGNKVARKDSNLVFQKQIQKLASVPVVLVVFFPSMAHRKKRNSIPSTQPATDQPLFHNNTLHEAWNCTSWRNKTGMHANPF